MSRVSRRTLAASALLLASSAAAVGGALMFGGSTATAAGTCSIYWTGASSTAWTSGANWSLADGGAASGTTPSATDFVCMSTTPTRSAVVASAANRTIAGIRFAVTPSVTPSLTVQGGTFTVNTNDSVINNLTETGSLAGSATVTLTGSTAWNGLTVYGGLKTVAAGSTLTISNTVTVGGGTATTAGSLTVAGSLVMNGSTLNLATSPSSGVANSVTISGTATLAGATIATSGSQPLKPALTLTGTMTTTGNTVVDTPFGNNGAVTVTAGTLSLTQGPAGFTETGTYALGSGTKLVLAGTRTLAANAVSGSGAVIVSGGTITFPSGTLTSLTVNGGTVSGSPTVGVFTGNGGRLSGTGTLTVTGSGSSVCGLTLAGGYRLLNQGAITADTTTSNCYISAFGTYANLGLAGGSVFENAGTYTVTGDSSFSSGIVAGDNNAANAVLNDAGATLTVTLASATTPTEIDPAFTNNGTVILGQGALSLTTGNSAGTTDTGTYSLAVGTVLNFGGGARTVSAGTVTGTGTLLVSGGTVTFNPGVTLSTLKVTGGTVSGSPTVGVFTGNGGRLSGTGTLTVTGSGSSVCGLTLAGGYRLLNQGAITADTTTSNCYISAFGTYANLGLAGGSVFENAGTYTVTGDSSFSSGIVAGDNNAANAVLNDAGATLTVTLASATTPTEIDPAFTNNGTVSTTKGGLYLNGTVTNLSSAGVLTGGIWNVAQGSTLRLPRTITTNAATVSVTGALTAQTTGAAALAALVSNTGSLTLGANLNTTTGVSNSGTVTVTAGTFRPTTYTQTSGTTTIGAGAALRGGTNGTGAIVVNGGVLTGTGAVQGTVSGGGTFAPGTAGTSTLTVAGPFSASSGATVAVSAGATTTTLAATGAVQVAGTLAISTTTPLPTVGTTQTVVSGASLTGTFATVTGADVPAANAYWTVGYSSTAVTVTLTAYPTVSVASTSTPEGNSNSTLQVQVSLSAPSPMPVTVAYSTSDGTATTPGDYTATSGTVMFPAGTTSQSIPVTIVGDTVYERDQTFTVTLSAPTGATLGTAVGTETIVNDDAAPVVSIADASGSIDKNGGTTIAFPVTLSAASEVPVSVSYATADGTATAPADYTATSGTLTIPAGSTSGQIQVVVPSQPGYAPPKTFTVTLSNPVDATLGTASATGTIVNTNQTGTNPTVTSVSPNLSAQGTTVAVTISGTDFAPGASVAVSGTGVTVTAVTVVNSARITATFTVASTATVGARDVTVPVPNASPATCAGCFTVTARPTVSTPSRTAFALGNVDVVFAVPGTQFGPGATLSLVKGTKSIDATSVTVNSSTSLTAVVSIAAKSTLGAYNVVVTNADGGTATCPNCVTVYAAPTLTSVSPSTIARGTSTAVTFTGTGFVAGTVVSVPGATLSNVVVVNATTITATVTPNRNAAAGARTVKVINPDAVGNGTATLAGGITFS